MLGVVTLAHILTGWIELTKINRFMRVTNGTDIDKTTHKTLDMFHDN